jgi:hypothetical protein
MQIASPPDTAWFAKSLLPDFTIGSIIPAVFDTYLAIQHPSFLCPESSAVRPTGSNESTQGFLRPGTEGKFDGECRELGALEDVVLEPLVEVLFAHAQKRSTVNMAFWSGYGNRNMVHMPGSQLAYGREYRVFSGDYNEIVGSAIIAVGAKPDFEPTNPTIMWSSSHDWFLGSDIDLAFSVLGASPVVVAEVMHKLATPVRIVRLNDSWIPA